MATVERGLGRDRTSYKCVLLFQLISLGLQLVGLIAPGWVVIDFGSSSSINMGLFLYRLCDKDGCSTESIDKHSPNPDLVRNLEESRGETISGFVAGLIGVVVTCRLHCVSLKYTGRLVHIMVLLIALALSGSLSMAAAGQWGRNLLEARELLSDAPILKTPYALILTGLGGIIAALSFLVITVNTCILYNKRNAIPSNQQPQPAEGQTYIVHAPPQGQIPYGPPVYSTVVPSAPPLYSYIDFYQDPHQQQLQQQQQQQHSQLYDQLELHQVQHHTHYR